MTVTDSPDRLAHYVERLEAVCGATAIVRDFPPFRPEAGRVAAVIFTDTPGKGYVTGFTYGLSLTSHPEWQAGGRELSISVRSTAIEWAEVPARTVAALRGMGPFSRGQVVGYQQPYVPPSEMSSILLTTPWEEWQPDLAGLDLGTPGTETGDPIEVIGVCPIYASERDFVRSNGVDAFLGLPWDRFDPLRPPAV